MTTKISGGLVKTATITGDNIAANTISANNVRSDVNIGGPKISSITYVGDNTAADTAGGETITLTGSGFNAGATVLLESVAVGSVTVANSTTITFTAPAKSTGSYIVYVVNTDGSTAILVPGIQYSGTPTWSTAAGSLGTAYEQTPIAATVSATGDGTISYSVVSGTLPAGSTLASNGQLSGTAPADTGSTTYTFTVRASDAQNQDTDRQFSVTINTDVVTWSSPANNTTYTWLTETANTVSLSATSAAGFNVSYSANTLPTGLSVSGSTITGTPTAAGNTTTLVTATAATTGRTATRTINWVINVASDTSWKNVSLILSANSSLQVNVFASDVSSNTHQILIAGDTRASTFSPFKQGYYSNQFDGTGDYLTVADNAAFATGVGDFTIEGWVFNTGTNGFIVAQTDNSTAPGSSFILYITSGALNALVYHSSSNYVSITDATAFPGNQWVHVALVRSSTTITLYVNGVSKGTANISGNAVNDASTTISIGARNSGGDPLTGYISNLRIVKGTAVYTGAFTPPTSPLTAITGTSLLTCQSARLIDASTNNFTITKAGDVKVAPGQPFAISNTMILSYGSGYFDGTGDYLMVSNTAPMDFGSGNFTVEWWGYPTAAALNRAVVWVTTKTGGLQSGSVDIRNDYITASSTTFYIDGGGASYFATYSGNILDQWHHFALVRNGATVTFYVNGTSIGSGSAGTQGTTNLNEINIGGGSSLPSSGYDQMLGYLSNFRVVKGTAVYTGNFTPPTSPLTVVANTQLLTLQYDGTHNSKSFIDSSSFTHLISRAGNTTAGTFSPYGDNWSNFFDGTGDYLTATIPTIGTQDYTVEMFVFADSTIATDNGIFTIADSPGYTSYQMFAAYFNGSLYTQNGGIQTAGTLNKNVWNHIALTRSGSSYRVFINGTQVGSTITASGNITRTALLIGGYYTASDYFWKGYISNFRIITGTALYTANFTAPTAPLTATSNTVMLTCQSNRFADNSTRNLAITRAGDTRVDPFSPFSEITVQKYYSAYFDGTGDSITTANSASAFSFGTGDWTIEFWINSSVTARVDPFSWNYAYSSSGWAAALFNTSGGTGGVSGSITWYENASPVITADSTGWNDGTWKHFAVTRSGNSVRMFLNGSQIGSTYTTSFTYGAANSGMILGASTFGSNITGYISNFRAVKGTALYTSSFTPSTTPLTAIANTVLLTCQDNTLKDNSTNALALTAAGDVKPLPVSPFTPTTPTTSSYSPSVFGGSIYFDGNGDHLTVANTTVFALPSDYTIECWVYMTTVQTCVFAGNIDSSGYGDWAFFYNASSGIRFLTGNGQTVLTGAYTFIPYTWTHVAVSRSGTSVKIFANGTLLSTTTDSNTNPFAGSMQIGRANDGALRLAGYLSDLRITKAALYTSNFYPGSTPLTPTTTVGSTTHQAALLLTGAESGIIDASRQVNLESTGDVKVTNRSPYASGGVSYYFDGTGDSLYSPSTDALSFGTGDFTVEYWMYFSGGTQRFVTGTNSGGTDTFMSYIFNGNELSVLMAGGVTSHTTSIATNTWHHIAVTRSGGILRQFLNGTQAGSNASVTSSILNSRVTIGNGIQYTGAVTGYMADIRITKGVARYTTNFTRPSEPFSTR